MPVLEILDYEHQLILQVLKVAHASARRMARHGAAVEPVGQALTGFCDKFISQCHQAKEFNLFRCLLQKERAYVVAPIAHFQAEHNRLAQLTESLGVAWRLTKDGHAGACELVVGYLKDYAALMQAHIRKEDRFFKVTQTLLEPADQLSLKAAFDKLEQEMLGADGHARYCQWAYQLTGLQP
jgi:hemerythrin-like domain-containing protein